MNMRILKILLALAVAPILGGCTAYPTTEVDFGNSVRSMIRNQRVVAGAVDTSPVEQTDGERAGNVLEIYRQDVSRPDEVEQPLVINVGRN